MVPSNFIVIALKAEKPEPKEDSCVPTFPFEGDINTVAPVVNEAVAECDPSVASMV